MSQILSNPKRAAFKRKDEYTHRYSSLLPPTPHGGMQCVSPQTAAVRHTNKVSVSQGCRSLPVVYTPLGWESICPPRERMTKLLINDARYLDILCFIQLLCLVTAGTAGEIIINLYILFIFFVSVPT